MDSKNQKIKRPKRQQKVIEDYWDCSVCTFRNTAEAFKCLMCDVRKGNLLIAFELCVRLDHDFCHDLNDSRVCLHIPGFYYLWKYQKVC